MAERSETITDRRRKTRNRIYQYLYLAEGLCTKQSVAMDLQLSLPTVHQNLAELLDAGLIRYAGEMQSTGGRRARGLIVVENARFAVGISIMDDRLRFVAANLRLQELAFKEVLCPSAMMKEDFGSILAKELENFLDENDLDREKLLGVGIAVPAVIDPVHSRICLAPRLHLRNSRLEALTSEIPYPCFVENDATSGGYAEWFARTDLGMSMAYVSLEYGVGGAVFVNGEPYGGDNRRSGEFGHMCVEPGGLQCKCGRRGCLEAYCTAWRISDNLGLTLGEFFDGVAAHNPELEQLWDDVLHHLAIGVNNVRMALDCDVVLGGLLSQYLEPYLPRLKEYAAAQNPFENNGNYLRLCKYPRQAVVLGVALHFIKEFLDNI